MLKDVFIISYYVVWGCYSSGGSGVTKVLKYFKQRKVSPKQEEEYHRFRILHNRLLQWRFINARAEIAVASAKNVAEVCSSLFWSMLVPSISKKLFVVNFRMV